MEATLTALGRVDVCFANAGISGAGTAIPDITAEGWDQTMAINTRGAALVYKHVTRHMIARAGQGDAGGKLIATSSGQSIMALDARQHPPSTVEEDDDGGCRCARAGVVGRGIEADGDRTRRPGNGSVLDSGQRVGIGLGCGVVVGTGLLRCSVAQGRNVVGGERGEQGRDIGIERHGASLLGARSPVRAGPIVGP